MSHLDNPSRSHRKVASALFAKANEIALFIEPHDRELDAEQHWILRQEEHILRTVGEVLQAQNLERFARRQIDLAEVAIGQCRDCLK